MAPRAAAPPSLKGDSSQRVTISLPHTLKGLTNAAEQHFGERGALRIFLNGKYQLVHEGQFAQVKDDDVLVMTFAGKRLKPEEARLLLSTHRADFVAPPPQDRRRRPRSAQPRAKPIPFDAKGTYERDFVVHRIPRPEIRNPEHKWTPCLAPTGDSEYRMSYQRGERIPSRLCHQRPDSAGPALRFTAQSSYAEHFVKHPMRRKVRQTVDAGDRFDCAFEGESTYRQDYHQHKCTPSRPRSAPAERAQEIPFTATSEYRISYLPSRRRGPRVHLEPERQRAPRA